MLYRSLLISITALGIAACSGGDYEERISGDITAPPPNNEETIPDSGKTQNGSLEESETEAVNWDNYANAGEASFEISTEQFYDGKQSLKATIAAVGENSWEIAAGPAAYDIDPDEASWEYRYSIWVLGTPGSKANFLVQLTESPWSPLAQQEVEIGNTWQRVTLNFKVPEGITKVQFPTQLSFEENAGNTVYLDSAKLTAKAPSGEITEVDIPIDENLSGWSKDGKATGLSFDPETGGIEITPNWDNNEDTQIAMYVYPEGEEKDYNGIELLYELVMPQEYIDAGVYLQTYVQQSSGSYSGQWTNHESLAAGDQVIGFTPVGAPTDARRVGLTIKGDSRSADPTVPLLLKRIYYKTSAEGPDLPLDQGWRTNPGSAGEVSYEGGVSYSPTAEGDQLVYDIAGPENYEGATFTFTIKVDQAFIDSEAQVQPFAQFKGGSWKGTWCTIESADLSTEGTAYDCELDTDDGSFNFEDGEEIQAGVQVLGSPAGTLTITDIQINPAGLPTDSGWRTNPGSSAGELSYTSEGVTYSPTAENDQLVYDLSGPKNYQGATFVFEIAVSQEYIDSGANVQPFGQEIGGSWGGKWCTINSEDLTTSGANYNCLFDDALFNLADEESSLQVGVQATGTPAGSITINSVSIIFAD